MGGKKKQEINTSQLAKVVYQIFELARQEKKYLILIGSFTLICALVYPYPKIAMWVGFMLAGYSAIANDSIQTIGTFIASNGHRKWYFLWLFMGLIFVATVLSSWLVYDGDVSSQRLMSKGFSEAPTSFNFLQLAAPLILLVLTRMRMPVSTTFLLLNAFSTESEAIIDVLYKSVSGYFLAFFAAIIIWFAVGKFASKMFKGKPGRLWMPVQWITSGALWSVWIQQDAANIAIFLPRQLSLVQFLGFTGFIFIGLGILFYLKGDRIQGIVSEKSGVTDVRAATLVDFVYALLLYYKLFESTIPMSTTWIFIGLLGGREMAIAINKTRTKKRTKAIAKGAKMIGKDLLFALIGLIVSLILTLAINDSIREEFFGITP